MGKLICPKCGKEGILERHPVDLGLRKEFWQIHHRRAVGLSIVESVCWFDAWPAPGKGKKREVSGRGTGRSLDGD
jgi:hypothetical protein